MKGTAERFSLSLCYTLTHMLTTFAENDRAMLSLLLYLLCTIAFLPEAFSRKKWAKNFFKVAPQPTRDSGHTPDPLADLPESSYLCQNRYRILCPYKVQDFLHQADSVFTLFSLLFTEKEKALTKNIVSAWFSIRGPNRAWTCDPLIMSQVLLTNWAIGPYFVCFWWFLRWASHRRSVITVR